MGEIRAAVDAGHLVIAHPDVVSVPGWSGAGYIILDQEHGAGAYKISGGANGGVLLIVAGFAIIGVLMFIAISVFAATGGGAIALAAFLGTELLLFLQALEFGSLIINVANSNCSADEKVEIISAAVFLLAIELAMAIFFKVKVESSSEKWRQELYELIEVIGAGASWGVISGLLAEINKPEFKCR